MEHVTLEELVRLREPGLEPGLARARQHLAGCAACQAEAYRLDQRVARMRALPALRPSRDFWPGVRRRLAAHRRRRLLLATCGGLAAAAGFALVVSLRTPGQDRVTSAPAVALSDAMTRSHELEQLLHAYDPDARVVDGYTEIGRAHV